MSHVIYIVGNSLGIPQPEDNHYLKEFVPDGDPMGHGKLTVTSQESEAKKFDSAREALEFWRQQSKRVPLRPDGKPNRPLTAYTIEILKTGEIPL